MKIHIVAIGKERDFPAYDLVTEYSTRIGHYLPLAWHYIPASTADKEAAQISKYIDGCGAGVVVVMLDQGGREYSSTELSTFLQKRLNEGVRTLVILIGGAYGFDAAMRARADYTVALSQLTFPHQLVRLILAEQIYRACTIMKGEKYHHQ